jgi:hypothetical protein
MMVERFNRTLQDKIHRDFTENNDKKYVVDLPDLLHNYNNSIHSSINQKPIDINKTNERAKYKYQYGYDIKSGPNDLIEFEFEIGDYVRSVIPKKLFEKGFTIKWSTEIYIVHERIPSHPLTYKIKTIEGEVVINRAHNVEQIYYKEQLIKTSNEEFPIDSFKVIDEKEQLLLILKLNTNHSSDHSKYNFDYYFSAEIRSYNNIKNFIEDNKSDINGSEFVEVYVALDFASIIKSIHILNNESKAFVVMNNYEIYDKWNIDDLYAYLIKIYSKQIEKRLISITTKNNNLKISSN